MLTKRQKNILDYVNKYIKENDYAPTFEEIKRHFRLSSVATVHQHVEALREKGYLKNSSRSIELNRKIKSSDLAEIPIVGTITAGKPIEAIEVPDETISIPNEGLGKSNHYYALRVAGNSMIEEGIFDGDIVVIKKQPVAENGQTVVAIIDDNEATLKRIYRERNRFRLQPANQEILPLYRKEVEVRGIVVKIIRDLENKTSKTIAAEIFEAKKKSFLESIKGNSSNGRNKYKRVVETPIRYAGGKSLAVGYIVELLPNNIKRLISPFFGGGSVEIACNKHLDLEVIGFDIFDILVNYWKIQISNPKALFRKLSLFKPDKKTYNEVKKRLKVHWENKIKLSPIDLAAHYYFNHNLSYGPGFLGWPSQVYLNEKRYKIILERVKNFSVKNLRVECASFEEVFKRYPNDFFYCDPPYYIGKDSKMFKGIYPMRNIPIHHKGFKHELLRDLLKEHKGGFILSYTNCPTIREWYKEFQQFFPSWQYTMGQGETRIGKNRRNRNSNHIKASHEIIIYCPPKN